LADVNFYLIRKSIVREYKSLFNFNQNIRSAITPCGTFLFSAGADTKIYCWNVDTGDLVTTSSVYLNYLKPARDIDFHPHDNFIVLCSYDSNAPVYLFTYNPDSKLKRFIFYVISFKEKIGLNCDSL